MPKSKSENVLEISIEGLKLKSLINLVKRYASDMESSTWNFQKGGIHISSVNKEKVSMIIVSVGKGFFESYKAPETTILGLDVVSLENLKTICRDAGNEVLSIRMGQDRAKFLFKYGNINRKMNNPDDEKPSIKKETIKNIYDGSKVIGDCKLEDLQLFIQASATWKGDAERVTRFTKNKKTFEVSTDLEEKIDCVTLDLNETLSKKTKEDALNILVMSQSLNNAVKQMKPLTENITLRGKTDYPLLIMAIDRDPDESLEFKDDLNWWYLLAPRIESE